MSMNDPISDLLARIRNATLAGHERLTVPVSRLKEEICRVLKAEGYIEDYRVTDPGPKGQIELTLRYTADRTPVLQGLRRVSKPSLRVYVGHDCIRPVRSGLGVSILSTPRGVMTGKTAQRSKAGGEVICEVW